MSHDLGREVSILLNSHVTSSKCHITCRPCKLTLHSISYISDFLSGLSSSLLGFGSTWLRLGGGLLHWALRLANGRGTSNSRSAEICSVTVLGNVGGNTCRGLAGGLVAAESDLVETGSWSLWVLLLLGDQSNTSLLSWNDTDSLQDQSVSSQPEHSSKP